MEKTVKFLEKKIITKTHFEEFVLVEQWEPNPGDNDPKKEFIIHDNVTYYLKSRKEKQY